MTIMQLRMGVRVIIMFGLFRIWPTLYTVHNQYTAGKAEAYSVRRVPFYTPLFIFLPALFDG